MINRLLYVATATALISVFMFDENFAANLSQAIGEPINIVPRDLWEGGLSFTARQNKRPSESRCRGAAQASNFFRSSAHSA
jgi:hypothetical protein